jgi:shikimate kinase
MKLILIGFMGSGKTSVAKLLSKNLHLKLIELDNLVLKASPRSSLKQIFEKDGELAFRTLEINQAKKLKHLQNAVISTGGGVVINQIILDYLKLNNGLVIFLKTSLPVIQARLKNDASRPLFKDINQAKKLFKLRQPLYRHYADLTIKTDHLSINQVVQTIIKNIKTKKI